MLPISRDSSGVLGLVEVDVLQALHHTFFAKDRLGEYNSIRQKTESILINIK